MFSSASTTENRGSAPRNTAASPQATCRSMSSALAGLELRQRRRDVHRDRRRADAALGADEREHLARDAWRPTARHSRLIAALQILFA